MCMTQHISASFLREWIKLESWDGKRRADRYKVVLTKGMEVVWKVQEKEVEGWFWLTALHLILHWHISEEDEDMLIKADISRWRFQAESACSYIRSRILCLEDSFSKIVKCCIWGPTLVNLDPLPRDGFWSWLETRFFWVPRKLPLPLLAPSFLLIWCVSKSGWNNKVWIFFLNFIFLVTQKSHGYCSCSMKLFCLSKSLLLAAVKLRLSQWTNAECHICRVICKGMSVLESWT